MEQDIEIIIGSPVDYEQLVAYIRIDGRDVALLSQDQGRERLEVVFENPGETRMMYDVLMAALAEAKRRLLR